MGAIQHLSTQDAPPEQRLAYWNDCARTTFPGMTVDTTRSPFQAELARWTLGDLVLARPRSLGSDVRRAALAGGEEQLILHLQRRGLVQQRQRSREHVLRPGDLSICTTAAPLQLVTEDHEMLVLQAPRAPLDLRVPDLDDRLGCVVSGAVPAARLLHDFLLSLWREGEACPDEPAWDAAMADILFDLLALALRGGERLAPARQDDVARLKRLVEARLGDPDLRAATLADELDVSVRWVQHLFASIATTPGAYIQSRRLARAADVLERDAAVSVTALAFDLGFNDSAYFSRCFRQRFGTSPSAWRARNRAAISP